ncbi:hypothetical protein ACSLFT_22475 [Streptomyces sp. G6]|uniref:hypothetical protein n=1 Tax=unclassified Streptomyces TaxID=2593676 RepID=UPI003789D345
MTVTLAGAWYESATFWAAATAFVTFAGIASTTWATLRAANPKRRLSYSMGYTRLLTSGSSRAHGALQVSHGGTVLADPRFVRVRLTNTSRRDISSSAFDQGTPIRLDIGVPILDILDTTSRPSANAIPPTTISGSEVSIGPGRIGRGQSLSYLLLIDGPDPRLTCQHALNEVEVVDAESDPYLMLLEEALTTPETFRALARKMMKDGARAFAILFLITVGIVVIVMGILAAVGVDLKK